MPCLQLIERQNDRGAFPVAYVNEKFDSHNAAKEECCSSEKTCSWKELGVRKNLCEELLEGIDDRTVIWKCKGCARVCEESKDAIDGSEQAILEQNKEALVLSSGAMCLSGNVIQMAPKIREMRVKKAIVLSCEIGAQMVRSLISIDVVAPLETVRVRCCPPG